MTIEFWPKHCSGRSRRVSRKRESGGREAALTYRFGKAHQLLSSAIICGDHELASWVDLVVKQHQVTGKPERLLELVQRLDAVMEPLPNVSPTQA